MHENRVEQVLDTCPQEKLKQPWQAPKPALTTSFSDKALLLIFVFAEIAKMVVLRLGY